jgi:hypothetical protein
MKAALWMGTEQVVYEEIETPDGGPGEALIRWPTAVSAAGPDHLPGGESPAKAPLVMCLNSPAPSWHRMATLCAGHASGGEPAG